MWARQYPPMEPLFSTTLFGMNTGDCMARIGNEDMLKHLNRLPREVVESPSPEVFKKCVDMDMVWQAWWCWVDGWTL